MSDVTEQRAVNVDWAAAVGRADPLARLSIVGGERDSWDYVAVRGLIALALLGAGRRDSGSPTVIPLSVVLVGLSDPERFERLAAWALRPATRRRRWRWPDIRSLLTRRSTSQPAPAEPRYDGSPAEVWAWLNRRWDPDAPDRWDGLPRGIARGLSDSAVDICLSWAANAVAREVESQRGALPRRTPVLITVGPQAGRAGFIESMAWKVDDDAHDLPPGAPQGYLITTSDGPVEHHVVPAEDFTVTTDAA